MVQYQSIGRTLSALGDPTRRAVLERLGTGGATITQLAEPFGMSLTGMKKHVHVLEEARLVSTEKVGRQRLCVLGPRRLEDLEEFIGFYRQMLDGQLDRLGEVLQRGTHDDRGPATKGEQDHAG